MGKKHDCIANHSRVSKDLQEQVRVKKQMIFKNTTEEEMMKKMTQPIILTVTLHLENKAKIKIKRELFWI